MSQSLPPAPYQHPPLRPLEQWLAPEASTWCDPHQGTALRDMALNFGIRRGLAAMLFVLGDVLVGFAVLSFIAFPESRAAWITAGVLGIACAYASFPLWNRSRTKLPRMTPADTFRSPTDTRSGLTLTVVIGIPLGFIAYFPLAPLLSHGQFGPAFFVGYYLLLLSAAVALFLVPGHFIGTARRDFRRFIATNPEPRAALEELSLTWRDPVANQAFGPL
ncbi:hypothetical protein [Paeniglutamicibacter cryotolerans]|uniref:Uncharacterized protein n=1 Tax=Paeniglutamicibacter cryotolerans TaxID=670079 RepID=A0A839QJP4_9MICC|nr:hypothetical protein [Paeniglutamicibacter cryotolerans]MBB2996060.1 hypothetical protein [Paeniglutamicibacter cryotolerans]